MWAGRVRIAHTLTNPISVIRGQVSAVDAAYYANKVDLSQHIAAPVHEILPGASVIIHAPVSLVQPTTFVFRAPEGLSQYHGMGRIRIAGALVTNGIQTQIDIKGDVKQLPVTLISYTAITGNFRAGAIPANTQLLFSSTAITLIRRRTK